MGIGKRRVLMKAYFSLSQFEYSPLGWPGHSKNLNKKINRIQKVAQWVVSRDYNSSSKELLQKANSITIHHKKSTIPCCRTLLTYWNFLVKRKFCNLRSGMELLKPMIRTGQFGSESAVFLSAKIEKSIPKNCPCQQCKT